MVSMNAILAIYKLLETPGAIATVACLAVLVLFGLWYSSRVVSPLRQKNFKQNVVYLFAFPQGFSDYIPDGCVSPFVLKLTAWMRLVKIPFEVRHTTKYGKLGKLPFIELNGVAVADSSFIIEHLTAHFHIKLDDYLTAKQRAVGNGLQRTVEESLYFGLMDMRWNSRTSELPFDNFREVTQPVIFRGVPSMIRGLVASHVRSWTLDRLMNQGIAAHPMSSMLHLCDMDLQSLSELLGDQSFFFGDRITSYDLCIFAQIWNLAYPPYKHPLRDLAMSRPNLLAFAERVRRACFGDKELPLAVGQKHD